MKDSLGGGGGGYCVYWTCNRQMYAVFEMRGGGSGGGLNPPITAQDPGIGAFQGDPGWVPKRPPPPPNIKMSSINCF